MFYFLTANNMPVFQWNVDTYGRRRHIYLLQLYICIIYIFIDSHDFRAQSRVSSKRLLLFFYYVQIHLSQMCTLWTEIQVYHLTRLM